MATGDQTSDAFTEEEERVQNLEGRLAATDWDDPVAAEQTAGSAREDFQWLLRRFRRTLKVADRMDFQLKSALQKEAAQKLELKQAYDRLKETQDELVRAEKLAALGGMVAGIAHEINTPLGIIRTSVTSLDAETKRLEKLAQDGQARKSDVFRYFQTAREATTLMEANAQRAADLIRSFKEVAVDRSSDARRAFDLQGYIEEVVQTLRPELKRTRLDVVVDCDAGIEIDGYPGAFAQVITNLVVNSIRHGYEPNGIGTLTFRGRRQGDGTIRLVYSDTGRGVAEEIRGKMFDPFVTTKRGQGGSGLGLHILHNLVVGKMGGRVTYADTDGGGASFVLTIPSTAPAAD